MRARPIWLLFCLLLRTLWGQEEEFYEGAFSADTILVEQRVLRPLTPKVNLVTGEYYEEECDLEVAGVEPLSYRRFYVHTHHRDRIHGHWRPNPESFLLLHFESAQATSTQTFASAGEARGGLFTYDKVNGKYLTLDGKKAKGMTHQGGLHGHHHPLNTRVLGCRTGVIEDGQGGKRVFSSKACSIPGDKESSTIFQGLITEERRPNGNILCYEYFDYNAVSKKSHRPYYVLKSITAYNASKTKKLGSLEINYTRAGKKGDGYTQRLSIRGSDGRQAVLEQAQRTVETSQYLSSAFGGKRKCIYSREETFLEKVQAPGKIPQLYKHRLKCDKKPFLNYSVDSRGCCLETKYDPESHKVLSQSAPVGPGGQIIALASYTYHPDHTVVLDGGGEKTIYRFNREKRITAVESYLGGALSHITRSQWDPDTGNLLRQTVENREGKLLWGISYRYDENHNVIEERLDGGGSVTRTYSKDRFNLKLTESDRSGKSTHWSYLPQTNLPLSEITYIQGKICKRTFYFYDLEIPSICTRTVIDDGNSLDSEDLRGVTFRQITERTPKRSLPCLGLPEEIYEKTINAQGKEILLKRVRQIYHPSGKLLSSEHYDANNAFCFALHWEYDAQERLVAIIDALGQRTEFQYDARFNCIAQVGPGDKHREWVYDAANRPIKEREWQSDGTVLTRSKDYDWASRLIASRDECGFETRFTYDGLGRLTKITHPDHAIEGREYNELGQLIRTVDALGYETRNCYNAQGQITDAFFSDGSEEHWSYTPQGLMATHIDRNGSKTQYSYDLFDHLIATKEELLRERTATWSVFSLISETDAEGASCFYYYDFSGRKIAERSGEEKTLFFYDSLGRLTRTQMGEKVSIALFDRLDRVIENRTEDLQGNVLLRETYRYDAWGNQTDVTNSKGTAQVQYNSRGQPLRQIDPLGHTTHFRYELKKGWFITETDPHDIKKESLHDCRGRRIEQWLKNSQGVLLKHILWAYDKNGNLLAETHDHLVNRWTYGPENRLESFLEAGERETRYLYDRQGRLQATLHPNTLLLSREYDALGRLSRYHSVDFDYRYTYDREDRLLTLIDRHSKTKTMRSYDRQGRLLTETLANDLTLSYTYDSRGLRTTCTLPDNSLITYTTHADQLRSVAYHGWIHTYTERDLEGYWTHAALPGSMGRSQCQRDALERCLGLSTPSYHSNLSYDPLGRLIGLETRDALGTQKVTYRYDDLNQLIDDLDHTYTWDSLHNPIYRDKARCQTNALCQITAIGSQQYRYDANGNLLSDGCHSYRYDSQNRLVEVLEEGITYTYDPFHRRLSKTTPQATIRFLWDGDHEIGSVDASGKIQELRILGEGLEAELGAAILIELQGEAYVPLHDHRGALIALLPLTGQESHTYRYASFGQELTGNTFCPWLFSSKRLDPETGFLFFGRRYYSPSLARWTTPDPAGFPDGPNRYAYVQNRPLTQLDPYGLFGWNDCWNFTKGFGRGLGDSLYGLGAGMVSMGEWLHADFQYEHFNDASYFQDKSQRAASQWSALGQECCALTQRFSDRPLNTLGNALGQVFTPGLMQLCNLSSNASTEQWGHAFATASLDLAILASSVMKACQVGRGLGAVELCGKKYHLKNFSRGEPKHQLRWLSPAKGRSVVNNIQYTTHALERMAPKGLIQSGTEMISRGVPPCVVENTIKFGSKSPGNTFQEVVHTFENVRVITNLNATKVITVIVTGK